MSAGFWLLTALLLWVLATIVALHVSRSGEVMVDADVRRSMAVRPTGRECGGPNRIGGRRDPAVLYGRFEPMEAAVPHLRKIVLLPGCGQWTQQERPDDVNAELIDFLGMVQIGSVRLDDVGRGFAANTPGA